MRTHLRTDINTLCCTGKIPALPEKVLQHLIRAAEDDQRVNGAPVCYQYYRGMGEWKTAFPWMVRQHRKRAAGRKEVEHERKDQGIIYGR